MFLFKINIISIIVLNAIIKINIHKFFNYVKNITKLIRFFNFHIIKKLKIILIIN